MSKPKRSLEDNGRRERANAAKAANTRERNIAQQYLKAGLNIGNLARAAYHWYNSVPMLGGQNENGNYLITGESPNPGMRSPKNIAKELKIIEDNYDKAIKVKDLVKAFILRNRHFNLKSTGSNASKQLYTHETNAKNIKSFDVNKTGQNYPDNSTRNGPGVYLNEVLPYDYDEMSMYKLYKDVTSERGIWGKNVMPLRVNFEEVPIIHSKYPVYNKNYRSSVNSFMPGEAFVQDPKIIKSADAITYDDAGNIILLSQRDNFNINDIRYGFLPIIGAGVGYGTARTYFDEQRPKQRNGGSIHIKPSKRGTFTAAATKHGMGVQEFASKVLRNKDNYSPAMVKKANFARNASKWNH